MGVAKKPLPDTALRGVQISIACVLGVLSILRRAPSPTIVLFLCAFVLGAFLWKVPPFEVGPKPGLHSGFLTATGRRAKSAALEVPLWAGACSVWFALIAGAIEYLSHPGTELRALAGPVGEWSLWGLFFGGIAGIIAWVCKRTIQDVRIMNARAAE